MDNLLVCLVLISFPATWAALSPIDRTDRTQINGINKATSTLRRYAPHDAAIGLQNTRKMTSSTQSKSPGPAGLRPIDDGGLHPKHAPFTKPTSPTAHQAGHSAFTVYKTSEQVGNMSDLLTFDSVTINDGNNFDVSTSIFTCTIPGMYVFSFTIITQDYPIMNLVRNQEVIATVFRSYDGAGLYDTISNTAVMQLQSGDQVFMLFMGYDQQSVYGDPYYKYTTFSGYLLY